MSVEGTIAKLKKELKKNRKKRFNVLTGKSNNNYRELAKKRREIEARLKKLGVHPKAPKKIMKKIKDEEENLEKLYEKRRKLMEELSKLNEKIAKAGEKLMHEEQSGHYCHNCGNKAEPGQRICEKCGIELETKEVIN